MGFRLTDMIPNAWFYKLKDMGKLRNQNSIMTQTHPKKKKHHQHRTSSSSSSSSIAVLPVSSSSKAASQQPHLSAHQRKSYYFTRDLMTPPAPSALYHHNAAATNRTTSSDNNYSEEPPRRSSKKKLRNSRRSSNRASPSDQGLVVSSSSVTAGCSSRATLESVWIKPDSTPEEYPNSPLDTSSENESLSPIPGFGSKPAPAHETFDGMLSWSASCSCRVDNDIINIGVEENYKALNAKFDYCDKLDGFDTTSKSDLPPIVTNPCKTEDLKEANEPTKLRRRRSTAKLGERSSYSYGSLSVKVVKEAANQHQKTSPATARRFSANSAARLKLRTNSPRIARIQGRKSVSSSSSGGSRSSRSRRRSVSQSFAVVKSSEDPQRDFRESMVEMIVENNICAPKDLEDLLACYLSLNSDEYHDLIITVFKQIWFDMVHIPRPSY